jgi:hypothetical protein
MTLGDFFVYLGENPTWVMAYFIAIPLLALWTGWMDRDNGHQSPWKYLHGLWAYCACIPGIFSIALSVYMFLFQRGGNIMNANLLTQVVPVISMVLTLSIIRRNVPWEYVPGTGRLSSLMTMIGACFILMYLLNRLHLVAFVAVPVHYLVLIVVGLLLAFRFAFKNLIA